MEHQRFDTRGVSPAERFDFWRTWHSEALDTAMQLEPVDGTPPDFRSSAETLTVDGVSIIELLCGPSVGTWHREGMEASDMLRVALFFRAHGVRAQWHGRDTAVRSGQPILIGRTAGFWRAPTGFRTIQVNVPRQALGIADAVVDRVTGRGLPGNSPVFESLVRPMLLGVIGHLGELSRAGPDIGTIWRSAVTMLVRSLDADARCADEELSAARLEQARRFIEANLSDQDLGPDVIAAALHVSRRTLYRLAAGQDGVAGMIRRQRLARSRAMLADPLHRHRSIAEIAAAVGTRSAAQFSRAFRAEYGTTPSEVRSSARARLDGRDTTADSSFYPLSWSSTGGSCPPPSPWDSSSGGTMPSSSSLGGGPSSGGPS